MRYELKEFTLTQWCVFIVICLIWLPFSLICFGISWIGNKGVEIVNFGNVRIRDWVENYWQFPLKSG